MSVIANLLKLETFGSYIRRYLLGILPEQLPLENMIEHVYVITEPKLNTLVVGTLILGCLIGIALTPVFKQNRVLSTQ